MRWLGFAFSCGAVMAGIHSAQTVLAVVGVLGMIVAFFFVINNPRF